MTWGPDDRRGLTKTPGGVTAAGGFRAGGIAAGLKPSGRPDLAVVAADGPATTAVTTTTNLFKAAPCVLTERHAANGRARAVVINAGNANACTGPEGLADAEATAAAAGRLLGVPPEDVLILSTGVIGQRLPMDRVLGGLPGAVRDITADGHERAATAIMTTDTRVKEVAYRVDDDAGSCVVGGMAKGAGMIEPAMATMLCIITTDAPLPAPVLRPLLRQAVERSFNRISIDACGSTNDAVVALASGTAARPPTLASVQRAFAAVCADLAYAVVEDGEGTNRRAFLHVRGAASDEDATRLARAVGASVLFRAALAGGDPNWGRILAAMGGSGVDFDPARVSVTCGGVTVCRFGTATVFDRGQAAIAMSKPEVDIDIDIGRGMGAATYLTTDLTPEYVRFNAEYTT